MRVSTLREQLARAGILPAALPLDQAAAYVGLSPRTFLKEVAAGRMPKPVDIAARRKLFSRAALDAAVHGRQARPVSTDEAIDEAINGYEP